VQEIEEIENRKQASTNLVETEICEMELHALKETLQGEINEYIKTGDFNKNDRYRIQLERENISRFEPNTFEILFAFEEFLRRKEEYEVERSYLSRDLSKRLLDAFNRAKENLIITISAFLGGRKLNF
jgi:hypothetical protein